MMGIMKRIDEKAHKKSSSIIAVLEKDYGVNALNEAKEALDKQNNTVTLLSIFGPVALAFAPVLLPWTTDWRLGNNYVNIAVALALIILLCIFLYRAHCYSGAYTQMQSSKEHLWTENEGLKKKLKMLKENRKYYVNTAKLIGDEIQSGTKDMEKLARIAISTFYVKLLTMLNGDNVTINIYEVNKNTIRMITSYAQSKYVTKEEDMEDNPFLYKNSYDINDDQIKDYYCVKCMKDNKKWYYLDHWTKIANEFKWSGWEDEENKKIIIEKADRGECKRLGFNYNQYLGIRYNHFGIIWYLEIITNNDTVFVGNFNSIAEEILDNYCLMIDVIWQIVYNK